jgi:hypothetical protein
MFRAGSGRGEKSSLGQGARRRLPRDCARTIRARIPCSASARRAPRHAPASPACPWHASSVTSLRAPCMSLIHAARTEWGVLRRAASSGAIWVWMRRRRPGPHAGPVWCLFAGCGAPILGKARSLASRPALLVPSRGYQARVDALTIRAPQCGGVSAFRDLRRPAQSLRTRRLSRQRARSATSCLTEKTPSMRSTSTQTMHSDLPRMTSTTCRRP